MNADEKLRVARLVTRLARQPDSPKDEEAELELAALMKVRPDAPYLLMQRALMLELALEQAQAQLQQLQGGAGAPGAQAAPREVPRPTGRSFWRSAGATPAVPVQSAPPGMASYGTRPMASGGLFGGGGGFLRNAAAMGAGVLGGSLLFHGLDSLFHDHGAEHRGDGGQGLLSGGEMGTPLEGLGDMQSPLDAMEGGGFADEGGGLAGLDDGGDEDWT